MEAAMPIAFWCVLLAGVLPLLTVGLAKWAAGYDNADPRRWAQGLDGYRRRAFAAHQNGFEAFPLFAAAVLAAAHLKAPQGTIDTLALIVILARLGYTFCYIADWPTLRSLVWLAGWLATVAIFTAPAWAGSPV
jgi:uncharacterized MAPEG superfamily protein